MEDKIDKSRRGFLKGLSLGIAGGIIGGPGIVVSDSNGALQAAEGVSPRPYPPPATGHIAHVSLDKTVCVGCGTCELVCALTHNDASGPSLRRPLVGNKEFSRFLRHVALPSMQRAGMLFCLSKRSVEYRPEKQGTIHRSRCLRGLPGLHRVLSPESTAHKF